VFQSLHLMREWHKAPVKAETKKGPQECWRLLCGHQARGSYLPPARTIGPALCVARIDDLAAAVDVPRLLAPLPALQQAFRQQVGGETR